MQDKELNTDTGYETRDANIRTIVFIGCTLLTLIGAVLVITNLAFDLLSNHWKKSDSAPSPLAETYRLPSGPRIQTTPSEEIQKLKEKEDSILNNYGWVDKKAGFVRIPIDRAIDITAKRGLPARKKSSEQ